ncbi:hypothetical protein DPEC_G00020640 [Dallia pectoralis]|uniref:Uncharacterized protein n=1 Tax=Dallia pectoralis TaxID=75939 RepID=A0ACC2HFW8_DALPE|nr:hypothetical protein DPEC_G00020640 [Dallia pectoralis]
MSFDSIPSKSEVLRWNHCNLSDYMKRLKLSGCDKVVMKSSLNGARFLNMTEKELQKFPSMHIPIIKNICGEINKTGDTKVLDWRSKETQNHKKDFFQEEESWGSEEFDLSDNDYERPDGDDSYICAVRDHLSHPPPGGADDDVDSDDSYELPPSSPTEEIPHLSIAKPLGNHDYIDSVAHPSGRTPRPPERPTSQARQRPAHAGKTLVKPPLPRPSHQNKGLNKPPLVPQIDRSKKPGRATLPRNITPQQYPPATAPVPKGSFNTFPQPPTVMSSQLKAMMSPNSFSSIKPPSSYPTSPFQPPSNFSTTKPAIVRATDMDPGWYAGLVSRGQAEAFLREVNKDAAFLVRDSSKGSSHQPYTLMVLCQDKVYNIQIRYKGETYHLGTGLMGSESFPGVKEMIDHYKQTPLLLIDAMERGTGVQNECCLLHPGLL